LLEPTLRGSDGGNEMASLEAAMARTGLDRDAPPSSYRMLGVLQFTSQGKGSAELTLQVAAGAATAFGGVREWRIRRLCTVLTHQRTYEACMAPDLPKVPFMDQLRRGSAAPRREAFSAQQSLEGLPASVESKLRQLTESQRAAVTSFLGARDEVQLVQGPPGTGKTSTVSTLLVALLAGPKEGERGPRVLVCAPSNAAVHVLADRVLALGEEAGVRFRAALVGVEEKLPPQKYRLQEVCVTHTPSPCRQDALSAPATTRFARPPPSLVLL